MAYQHYHAMNELINSPYTIYLVIFILQLVLVAVGIYRYRHIIRVWAAKRFTTWQFLGLALVFVLASAAVSRDVIFYLYDVIAASTVQAVHLANGILIILAMPIALVGRIQPVGEKLLGDTQPPSGKPGRVDRFVLVLSVWVVVAAAFLSYFIYQAHPHIPDEVAYLVQSQFLAQGKLTLPAPPVPQAFDFYLMQFRGDQWYPVPPVGWPAVLAIGQLAGVPWLVNPLLGGINLILAYLVLSSLYSIRVSRLSVLLLALSPWYVFMAMNFMTHTFTLTCALAATICVIVARWSGKSVWGWLGGFSLGALSLIRPLEGLLMAVLLGFWAIGVGGRRLKLAAIVGLVAGTVVVGGLVIPYNQSLSGQAGVFPINAYTDQRFGVNSNAYGFGADRGMDWPLDPNKGHSPIDGLINANLNTFSINIELFGWGMGSLLFVSYLVLSRRYQKSDTLMLVTIAAVFIVFFFYYFSGGPDFGARYWYLMIVPLVVLTVRGLQNLASVSGDGLSFHETAHVRLVSGVFLLSTITLITFFPWRITDKYVSYLNMRPDIRQMANQNNFGRSLVLIRGNSHPDYVSAAVYNPLNFDANVPIYAWDKDAETRDQLLAYYADRPVWVIEGPSLTGGPYRIIQGPVSAMDLLSESTGQP